MEQEKTGTTWQMTQLNVCSIGASGATARKSNNRRNPPSRTAEMTMAGATRTRFRSHLTGRRSPLARPLDTMKQKLIDEKGFWMVLCMGGQVTSTKGAPSDGFSPAILIKFPVVFPASFGPALHPISVPSGADCISFNIVVFGFSSVSFILFSRDTINVQQILCCGPPNNIEAVSLPRAFVICSY